MSTPDLAAVESCHELLLRLAGRLDDRQLWRMRDWLGAGALDAVAHALPLMLLRERLAVTSEEFGLLSAALRDAGADQARVNAVPWLDELPEVDYTFTPESLERVNSDLVVLGAMLRGRAEVVEAECAWRLRRSGSGLPVRVVLITATGECARLAADVQRVLRAIGTPAPAVEVLPEGFSTGPYHRAALAAAEPLFVEGQMARV